MEYKSSDDVILMTEITKIFVDMDGVLADFIQGVEGPKYLNGPFDKQSYYDNRKIELSNAGLFFDLPPMSDMQTLVDYVKGTGIDWGSGRRLYTDENPKDTVSIKFATMKDATATVNKVKRIKKPFARKIQILTVGEQRAKVMGKTGIANVFKRGKDQIRKAHGKK